MVFFALFTGTAGGLLSLSTSSHASGGILLLLWINSVIMLVGLGIEASRRPYSLNLMHLMALYLFLGAAALFQYASGEFPLAGPIVLLRPELLVASVAISIWVLGYLVGYEATHLLTRPGTGPATRFLNRPIPHSRVFVLLVIALVSLFYLAAIGLTGASTRGAARAAVEQYAGIDPMGGAGGARFGLAYFLFHQMFLRALSPFAFLAGLLLLARDPRSRNLLFVGLVAAVGFGTLVVNNPFAAARLWFATALIALVAPFVLRRLRTGWGLVLITLGGITLLPVLHLGRYFETLDEFTASFELASPITYLADNADVDSLGTLALTQKWIDLNGHRWGLQIVGGLLFWFPRTFWPGKPIDTGGMVTDGLGFEFTNWAVPVIAEPLVDFGLLGVMPFAAFFGMLFARLDRAYWDVEPQRGVLRLLDCVYPFLMGCVLFITRGGWFASLSFTFVFTIWLIPLGFGAARSARRTDGHPENSSLPVSSARDGTAQA